NGVVSRIYTSGLRGPLAEEISRGLLAEPVQIHSHGGRVHLVHDMMALGEKIELHTFGKFSPFTGQNVVNHGFETDKRKLMS
ncbi:hypothetical protein ONQ62_29065, partial [Salmonella enterica subsp. enterica serovar Virginia]|nr:hypothetical protein [Salmonella enterica subsp. enterica serovar Virginia]